MDNSEAIEVMFGSIVDTAAGVLAAHHEGEYERCGSLLARLARDADMISLHYQRLGYDFDDEVDPSDDDMWSAVTADNDNMYAWQQFYIIMSIAANGVKRNMLRSLEQAEFLLDTYKEEEE